MTREEIENYIDDKKRITNESLVKVISVPQVQYLTDKILSDFESRTCESCKYSDMASATDCFMCDFSVDDGTTMSYTQLVHKDFGCNKWSSK